MTSEELDKLYDKIDGNRNKIDEAVANEMDDVLYDKIADWIVDILKNSDLFENVDIIDWKLIRNGLNTAKDEYKNELNEVIQLYTDSAIGDILNML